MGIQTEFGLCFQLPFFIKFQNFHWIIRHSHHWTFFLSLIYRLSLRIGLADIQDLCVLSWKTPWKSLNQLEGNSSTVKLSHRAGQKEGLELSLSILGLTCLPLTFIRCVVIQVWSWPRSVNGECIGVK